MTGFTFFNIRSAIRSKDRPKERLKEREPTETKDYMFYLSVLSLVLSCITLLMHSKRPPSLKEHIVVVDMKDLLRQKATELVHAKGLEDESVKRGIHLERYAKRIREVIEAYAGEHQVMVISKGVIFCEELQEVTDAIRNRL